MEDQALLCHGEADYISCHKLVLPGNNYIALCVIVSDWYMLVHP